MKYPSFSFIRNRSVFFKLLVVLIITAIIISTITIGLVGRNIFKLSRKFIDKFAEASVERIVDDLGEPPTLKNAEKISEKFGIDIRFESKADSWSTAYDFPPSHELNFKGWHRDAPIKRRFIHVQNKMYIMIEKNERKYLFSPKYVFTTQKILFFNITTLLIIIFVFSAAYWALRKILNPIQTLKQGVIKVGEGHLDLTLPVHNKDELGQLTDHFNQMISRFKEMLHSKERLLLDVSHELRSPLTRMKIAIEFLPDSKHKLSINEDINSLDTMLTELLESARLESSFGKLNLVELNINQVIQNVISGFTNQPVDIKLTSVPEDIFAKIDQMRFEIVLKNLINNAIKYTKNDLSLDIELQQTSNEVLITVADHGRGIPESELPFLFEPFYRVDKSRSKKTGGFGLGLSICKQIIEAHKGSIKIQSVLDQGTKIMISIPF